MKYLTQALVFGLNYYLLTFIVIAIIWLSSEVIGGGLYQTGGVEAARLKRDGKK